MVVAGAGGHAKELLDILLKDKFEGVVTFFENISNDDYKIFDCNVTSNLYILNEIFKLNPLFVLGTGNPYLRYKLKELLTSYGGVVSRIISSSSIISNLNTFIGDGCNIMPFCFISNNVYIGEGSLINTRANVHHDVIIGNYCEISPSAILLGKVVIGNFTLIGSGAIVLPGVKIGNNCIIGAGAVVSKNIPDDTLAFGVPAKINRSLLQSKQI